MSIWNHLEHWLPAPGRTESARKFYPMVTIEELANE